jgi:AraC-like DNA-binding protein
MSERERALSGFVERGNALQIRGFPPASYGQSCPQHYPQVTQYGNELLGLPLSIREVARLIGCSVWTVRQNYLPQGLPHLRSGPHGKLIFFHDQVVRWILQHQQKGGKSK